jgi:flagellin
MALVVNTNVASITSQMYVNQTNKDMGDTMARLSSGKRINTAADDAAGLAISSRLTSQVNGLNQAIRNAQDGQSLIDTTEGAHNEITNILQRMRELAVQSANDTNVASDRQNIQAEVDQLVAEINRISEQTTWNGEKVLDGSFTSKQLQIGADSGQIVTFDVDNTHSTAIGSYTELSDQAVVATGVTGGAAIAGDVDATNITITGHLGSNASVLAVTDGMSAKDIAALVNGVTSETGVSATAVTKAKLQDLDTDGAISMSINGVAIASSSNTTSDLRNLRDAINAAAASSGVTAAVASGDNSSLVLTASDGRDIAISSFSHSVADSELDVVALDQDGANATSAVVLAEAGAAGTDRAAATVTGQVKLASTHDFTMSGDAASVFATSEDADLSSVSNVSVATVTGAKNAIDTIDGAISKINAARADLGAISNRLDNTVANLSNIAINVESSRSQIEDADFAAESANLAKQQIMLQAGTAMLAQANAAQQNVLSLLG